MLVSWSWGSEEGIHSLDSNGVCKLAAHDGDSGAGADDNAESHNCRFAAARTSHNASERGRTRAQLGSLLHTEKE